MMRFKGHDLHIHQILDNTMQLVYGAPQEQSVRHLLLEAKALLHDEVNRFRVKVDEFEEVSLKIKQFTEHLYNQTAKNYLSPLSEGIERLPRLVRDLALKLNKKIRLSIAGSETLVDRVILEKMDIPLSHIIRNACYHGIESPSQRLEQGKDECGVIHVRARHHAGFLIVEVSDDGQGIDIKKLKDKLVEQGMISSEKAHSLSSQKTLNYLFMSGFSTAQEVTDISGRGVGLDIVHDFVEKEGGVVRISTDLKQGTTFTLELPITRSVIKALVIGNHHCVYAIPFSSIHKVCHLEVNKLTAHKNYYTAVVDNFSLPLFPLHEILAIKEVTTYSEDIVSVVILKDNHRSFGIIVENIVGHSNLVIMPLDVKLGKMACVSAGSIMDNGSPVIILDTDDILEIMNKQLSRKSTRYRISRPIKSIHENKLKEILLVDDSESIREAQMQVLKKEGYEVITATNGQEAWMTLQKRPIDLVITDLEMPVVNGFDLIKLIRSNAIIEDLPIIVVSSKDSLEDRQRAVHYGGSDYISKNHFLQKDLVNAVKNWLN